MFDDVIVMLILCRHQNETAEKIADFRAFLAEYLKNAPTDFHQTYVIFKQLYIKVLKLKDWR